MKELIMSTFSKSELQDMFREVMSDSISSLAKDMISPNKVQNDDKIINTSEAAEFLGISRMTLFRRMKLGQVPYKRLGRRVMFSKLQLTDWIRESEVRS